MNRRQKKERLKHLRQIEIDSAERRAVAKRMHQEKFALDWHRQWIREEWANRREFRRKREANTPKTSTDTW